MLLAAAVLITLTRNWNAWEGGRIDQVTDDAIVRDNFGDWEESGNFMRISAEFDAMAMGSYFDPEKMVAIRAAGATAGDIHRRAYAGELSLTSASSRAFLCRRSRGRAKSGAR